MSFSLVNVGTSPDAGDGDDLRTAFLKVNAFLQAYADLATALGGTDLVAALDELSAALAARAAAGANGDITSLSGLTTALSLAQGGTGAKTAPAARLALGLPLAPADPGFQAFVVEMLTAFRAALPSLPASDADIPAAGGWFSNGSGFVFIPAR